LNGGKSNEGGIQSFKHHHRRVSFLVTTHEKKSRIKSNPSSSLFCEKWSFSALLAIKKI
jgi:hypothetical protein